MQNSATSHSAPASAALHWTVFGANTSVGHTEAVQTSETSHTEVAPRHSRFAQSGSSQ